jgi:pimeloyl-ACP methyl ester carboxylesterase
VVAVPQLELTQGTVQYREEGSGPPVVLIHGALVDGHVWDRVISKLSPRARCIVPDLPLGSHRIPMNEDADLSPLGLGRLIAELIERLELADVTLVGNDTGGALCQITTAYHPDRIGRLVLTNCDAFENFPPRTMRFAVRALAYTPGMVASTALLGRIRWVRDKSMEVMRLTVEPVPDELVNSWIVPLRDRRIRRDLVRVLRGMSSKHTLAAAERLRRFDRPVLIAWGTEDRMFSFKDAERLESLLPDARLEKIEHSRAFVQMDEPERLAELVAEFASQQTAAA